MGAIAGISDYLPVLKTIWPQSDLEDLFYDESPFLAMVPKDTSWVGENRVIALQYGKTNGRSALFANAKANKGASKFGAMTITTADNFSLFSVDHKTIQLSRDNKGAIVKALTTESKSAIDKLKRITGAQLWNNGGGAIGVVSALSGATFKFVNPLSARLLEPGDWINLSTDDGTGGAGTLGPGNKIQVIDVNTNIDGANAGLVTCSGTITGSIAAAANGNFVFIDGDYGAWLSGVPAYVTPSDPGSGGVPTSIWGMSREAFPSRLAGLRVDGTGLSIKEAIKKALMVSVLQSAKISHIFMNPENFLDLEMSLESQKRYVDVKVGNVGFTGIAFTGGTGSAPVEVYQDPDAPKDTVFGLNLDTWTLASAGELADFFTLPGQSNLRPEESTNSFEGRVGNYAQLYTDAPGKNFTLKLA